MSVDMSGKNVLITGGTRGIGRACAEAFASAGARVVCTHRWGSVDEEEMRAKFVARGWQEPVILEADVSNEGDTRRILEGLVQEMRRLDVFVSNAGCAQKTASLDEYKKSTFYKTLDYSSWPLIAYTREIRAVFGSYPAYILGISSDGPDHFYAGYDFVAASKALLELLARYLSMHLFGEGSRVNVLRFGPVKTESFDQFFGNRFFEFVEQAGVPPEMLVTADECGQAAVALCSGLLDGVNGQVITVDNGLSLRGNLMMSYLEEEKKRERQKS